MPRRFRDIFDMFDQMFEDFEKEFEEMERQFMRGFDKGEVKEYGPYVYGFRVTVGPDGKPKVEEFGNVKKLSGGKPVLSDEREPLVDVIEKDNEVRVIAEMPGVEKDKIKVKLSGSKLQVNAEGQDRKYNKSIDVPPGIDENSIKASYKNGVLEVVMRKKQSESGTKEIKVE